jgi:hypothetical protein
MFMPRQATLLAAFAALSFALGGCADSEHAKVQCPQVVTYTDAQLDAIQQSINRLPKNDPLRGAMQDYENLRDDARYCINLLKDG